MKMTKKFKDLNETFNVNDEIPVDITPKNVDVDVCVNITSNFRNLHFNSNG